MPIDESRSSLDKSMKYVDVHSHWTDLRRHSTDESLQEELEKCRQRGLDFFLLGGVEPEEWQRQLRLQKQFPEHFGLCFGLHPYFISAHEAPDCESALDQLAQVLPQALAIGESGLDFRPHIMKESQTLQIEMFENQLELAKAFMKPMVLHVVQAHEKALQVMHIWQGPPRGGLVHAFAGSYEVAKKYTDLGFLVSVGGALTFKKNHKLRDCVKKLPLEYLLIESDAPDQAPEGMKSQHSSLSIFKVAEEIALIKNISPLEVLESNTSNFKRLFRL